jgi:uncharacterized protein with HEPN domain
VSRRPPDRLHDIVTACTTIEAYAARAEDKELLEGLVVDAIRMRLLEIGEAVKALDPALLALEPGVPWNEVARMRDLLAHRYYGTDHAIVTTTARRRVPALRAAAERLLQAWPKE